jgi:hypothetical protein
MDENVNTFGYVKQDGRNWSTLTAYESRTRGCGSGLDFFSIIKLCLPLLYKCLIEFTLAIFIILKKLKTLSKINIWTSLDDFRMQSTTLSYCK